MVYDKSALFILIELEIYPKSEIKKKSGEWKTKGRCGWWAWSQETEVSL